MSIGASLAYQLRPNKAIERGLFIELLSRLDRFLPVGKEYKYYGFGGPQMEDFRLLNERFPEMKMQSIEREPHLLKRQRFNGPHTNVRCALTTSSEFIDQFSPRGRVIVWLDYTKPAERMEQVVEFQNLLRKVPNGSVIKITMNAAASSLGGDASKPGFNAVRRDNLKKDFEKCFPNGLEEDQVTKQSFPETLLTILEYASAEVLRDRADWRFAPLTSACYADGQMMLTLSGIAGKQELIEMLLNAEELKSWKFARFGWVNPVEIEVPELTLKERICVNQCLPKHQDNIPRLHRKLGFYVEKKMEDSERKLRNYVSFQRHYPHFGKVNI